MTDPMTDPLAPGAPLPDLTLEGPAGPVSLETLRDGHALVIAFYVEDNTPTCSAQLCAFRDDYDLVEELGAVFVGISADSAATHAAFAEQQSLPFALLADPDLAAAHAFGVLDETGKHSIRALFVTDAAGRDRGDDSLLQPGQYPAVPGRVRRAGHGRGLTGMAPAALPATAFTHLQSNARAIMELQIALCEIPAPTNEGAARAETVAHWLRSAGCAVEQDDAGNVHWPPRRRGGRGRPLCSPHTWIRSSRRIRRWPWRGRASRACIRPG